MTLQDFIDALDSLSKTSKNLTIKFSIRTEKGLFDPTNIIDNATQFGMPIVEVELVENRND